LEITNMNFGTPIYLAALIALAPMVWFAGRRRKTVGHSQVDLHKNVGAIPFVGWIPTALLVLTWTMLCIGLAQPRLTQVTEKQTAQARDFVVLVDVSGSMSSALQDPAQQTFVGQQTPGQNGNTAPTTDATGTTPGAPATPPPPPTRANAARQGVKLFVDQRSGDRVALLLFDDEVYYVWPLTSDLKTIDRKLYLIDKYNGGGTNFDGPNPDYPGSKVGGIQGAINHFKQLSDAKTKVLIMVTDGEDSISPKRYAELQAQMKQLGIHMYVLGVGESWGSGSKPDLQRFCEDLGGTVIPVGNAQAMRDGFATISRLEKSTVEIDRTTGFRELYQYFLYAALVLALLYKLSSALVREEE
jgi:Mg-chelatase subunit ChlD